MRALVVPIIRRNVHNGKIWVYNDQTNKLASLFINVPRTDDVSEMSNPIQIDDMGRWQMYAPDDRLFVDDDGVPLRWEFFDQNGLLRYTIRQPMSGGSGLNLSQLLQTLITDNRVTVNQEGDKIVIGVDIDVLRDQILTRITSDDGTVDIKYYGEQKRVDLSVAPALAEIVTQVFNFAGIQSSTRPPSAPNNAIWIHDDGIGMPSFTGGVVQKYVNGSWTTFNYTPKDWDTITNNNLNPSSVWFWLGGSWHALDISTNTTLTITRGRDVLGTFNPTQGSANINISVYGNRMWGPYEFTFNGSYTQGYIINIPSFPSSDVLNFVPGDIVIRTSAITNSKNENDLWIVHSTSGVSCTLQYLAPAATTLHDSNLGAGVGTITDFGYLPGLSMGAFVFTTNKLGIVIDTTDIGHIKVLTIVDWSSATGGSGVSPQTAYATSSQLSNTIGGTATIQSGTSNVGRVVYSTNTASLNVIGVVESVGSNQDRVVKTIYIPADLSNLNMGGGAQEYTIQQNTTQTLNLAANTLILVIKNPNNISGAKILLKNATGGDSWGTTRRVLYIMQTSSNVNQVQIGGSGANQTNISFNVGAQQQAVCVICDGYAMYQQSSAGGPVN